MKQLITLSSFLLILNGVFGGPRETRLSVSMMADYPVAVFIDGRATGQYAMSDRECLFTELNPGQHRVEVYRMGAQGYHGNRRFGRAIFKGTVLLKSGFHLDIFINRFGRAFTDERQITWGGYGGCGDYGYDDQGGYPYFGNDANVMSAASWDNLMVTLKKIPFEDTRISSARTALSGKSLNTGQVRQLMDAFSFEKSKLDIAKFCYPLTVDPENYFMIHDSFAFNSSRDEMNDFISRNL